MNMLKRMGICLGMDVKFAGSLEPEVEQYQLNLTKGVTDISEKVFSLHDYIHYLLHHRGWSICSDVVVMCNAQEVSWCETCDFS